MNAIFLYTFAFGRMARSAWLGRLALLGVAATALGMLAQALIGSAGAALCAAGFSWCATALSVQRLHDSGSSGWRLLALLVPIIGPLWLAGQLMRRGSAGANRYGDDPRTRADYLQVDISK